MRNPANPRTQAPEILAEIERRRFELSLGLLRIYNYYRTFVGIALIAAFSQDYFDTQLGSYAPTLFLMGCLAYTGFNLLTVLLLSVLPRGWFRGQFIHLALVTGDTLALAVLTYASGGIGSGIAALILVTVVTGAILVTGRRDAGCSDGQHRDSL